MRHAGILVSIAACALAMCAQPAAAAEPGTQTVAPRQVQTNPPPPDEGEDYRPPWADPDAKPPEAGIDDDPTQFNPTNVDGSSPLDNN
jgi:hypothetical protein